MKTKEEVKKAFVEFYGESDARAYYEDEIDFVTNLLDQKLKESQEKIKELEDKNKRIAKEYKNVQKQRDGKFSENETLEEQISSLSQKIEESEKLRFIQRNEINILNTQLEEQKRVIEEVERLLKLHLKFRSKGDGYLEEIFELLSSLNNTD